MEATKEERIKTVPKVRADNGPNEWNRFTITLKGNRVDVLLNGILTGKKGVRNRFYTVPDTLPPIGTPYGK